MVLVVAKSSIVSCEIRGGLALLDVGTNKYFSLNATGASVWQFLSNPRSVDEISKLLAEEFGVSPEECGPDVLAVINTLHRAGLVEMDGTPVA